ncbi:MAG: hypothetical protein Ct9H300mP1_22820 [Planctomycetaceae bacterium]|nr:MAG: hypothetical protein Ct9H300mP1_22820 [Planctomycetaceae bacterium]
MGAAGLANTHHLNRSATAAPAKRPPAPPGRSLSCCGKGGHEPAGKRGPQAVCSAEIRGSFSTMPQRCPSFGLANTCPVCPGRQACSTWSAASTWTTHAVTTAPVSLGPDRIRQPGRRRVPPESQSPSLGRRVVAPQLGTTTPPVPPISLPFPTPNSSATVSATPARSFWGAACDAFDSGVVPETATGRYRTPKGLTFPRRCLCCSSARPPAAAGGFRRPTEFPSRLAAAENFDAFRQQSFELLLGQQGQQAFDLNSESRPGFGKCTEPIDGPGTLLARRLVEAGVTYVLVNYSRNNSWEPQQQFQDPQEHPVAPHGPGRFCPAR